MDDEQEKWTREYQMTVKPSNRRLRRIPQLRLPVSVWDVEISDAAMYQTINSEEVDCVDILMPRDMFEQLYNMHSYYNGIEEEYRKSRDKADVIVQREHEDQKVRIKYPAVADAYHAYRTILELCR